MAEQRTPDHDLVLEVETLLLDHEKYHSSFQIDHFITSKAGGTTYGMYRQALREMGKRYENLKRQYIEHKRANIDRAELEHDIKRAKGADGRPLSKFDLERKKLDLTEKVMEHEAAERVTQDLTREFLRFLGQAQALKKELGPISALTRKVLDRAMWVHKMKQKVALDLWANGRLTSNVLDNIMVLPFDDQQKVLDFASNREAAMAWLPSSFNGMPEYDIPQLGTHEVERLLDAND